MRCVMLRDIILHELFISTTSGSEVPTDTEQGVIPPTAYSYIPYVLNHGYNTQTVGHELAQLSIPYHVESSSSEGSGDRRTGKAASIFTRDEANTLNSPKGKESGTDGITVGSYSYIDTEGNLKTTKDMQDIITFGFRMPSTNLPEEGLASPVASKILSGSKDNFNTLLLIYPIQSSS